MFFWKCVFRIYFSRPQYTDWANGRCKYMAALIVIFEPLSSDGTSGEPADGPSAKKQKTTRT